MPPFLPSQVTDGALRWLLSNALLTSRAEEPLTPRQGAVMAFDPHGKRMLLFGGFGREGVQDGTFRWDGAKWRPIASEGPPGQASARASWDRARGELLLFGGNIFGDLLDHTWILSGSQWTRRNPSIPKPDRRDGQVMAYDAKRKRIVLFGGFAEGDDGLDSRSDTWEWDGEVWSQVRTDVAPSSYGDHAMCPDPLGRGLLLYDGNAAETWRFDGHSWILTNLKGDSPPRRTGFAMAYDAKRKRVVLFGGSSSDDAAGLHEPVQLADTWEWDGSRWHHIPVPSGRSPCPRSDHSMAYDEAQDQIMIFGGRTGRRGYAGDTWAWNGQTWTLLDDLAPAPS